MSHSRERTFRAEQRGSARESHVENKVVTRRQALGILGSAGAALSFAGCGDSPASPSSTTTSTPRQQLPHRQRARRRLRRRPGRFPR
jgi:hypothetical protein